MAQIIWTESALQDLNDIAEYIAIENVVAAEQLVETVFAKVERMANHLLISLMCKIMNICRIAWLFLRGSPEANAHFLKVER
jgi:hypothetical protein